jgi:hypothetical protein
MNFIYFTLLFSIIMIILNFAYISVGIFDFFIRIPFISQEPIYVPPFIREQLDNVKSNILYYGNPVLILFIIFYIIFYIIYLIIITIIPDTGIQTLFIPLKELLLQIPPLPELQQFGIFKLFECIIDSFGLLHTFKGFIKINLCFMKFSKDNIKTILNMIFKDTDFKLFDNNNDNNNDKINNKKTNNENIIHKQINQDVNICYKNNRIPLRIGMTEVQKQKIEFENNQIYIKCKANSIGKYIRII